MLSEVISNIGLLSICPIGLFLIASNMPDVRRLAGVGLLTGIVFGAVGSLVILLPATVEGSATFDTRMGPALVAGMLAGPIGGGVAGAMEAAARLSTGGPFAIGGAISGLLYGITGVLVGRYWYEKRTVSEQSVSSLHFVVIAVLASGVALPCFFVDLSLSDSIAALANAGPVLLLGNVLSVVIVGVLCISVQAVVNQRNRYQELVWTTELAGTAAGVGIWSLDPPDGQLSWDNQMFQIYGARPEVFDGLYGFFAQRVHPDDRGPVEEAFLASIKRGTDFDGVFRIVRDDGTLRHVKACARQFQRPGGEGKRIIGVNWDITDEVMAQMENRLRSQAMESANHGMAIVKAGAAMEIESVNHAFQRITGYLRQDALGSSLNTLFRPGQDNPVDVASMNAALSRNEEFAGMLTCLRKDGAEFQGDVRVSPVPDDDGCICYNVVTIEDVTDQVQLSKDRRRIGERLNTILETAPDAFLTVGEDRKIKVVNAAAETLFGWSRDEIVGQELNILVPEEYRDEHAIRQDTYLKAPVAKAGAMAPRVVDALRRDGSTFPALIALGRYEIDGDSEVTAIVHDMSEFMAMNRALEEVSQRLSEELAKAEDASVAKTRFLANMSHELRTPLNAIIGFSEAMRHGIFGELDPRYKKYAEDIQASGEHLLDLINDVLDVARLEREQVELDLIPMDPRHVVTRALRSTRPMLTKKDLRLQIRAGRDLPTVMLDKRAIQQCLLNILSNAIRHTPKGGQISITVQSQDDRISFALSDTGEGMDENRLARVGRPFEAVNTSEAYIAEHGGTGLGLAITKELTEAMGGRFVVTSTLGVGTTVTLVFPLPGTYGAARAVEILPGAAPRVPTLI